MLAQCARNPLVIHSSCKPLLDSRLLLSAPADRPSVSRYLVQSAYQRENARESARGPEQWSSWQQQLVLKWCIFTCLPQTERSSAPWVHELPGREARATPTARGHDLQLCCNTTAGGVASTEETLTLPWNPIAASAPCRYRMERTRLGT